MGEKGEGERESELRPHLFNPTLTTVRQDVDLYSASCGYQPPLMRCHVTNGSRLTTQATAHSLRTPAWAAT